MTVTSSEQSEFLIRVSVLLSSSLDYGSTLRSIADLLVPRFADYCMLDVLEADGLLYRVAIRAADPAKQAYLEEIRSQFPKRPLIDPDDWNAETLTPHLAATRNYESDLKENPAPGRAEALRRLTPRSSIETPLIARDRFQGVLHAFQSESGRNYDEEDLPMFAEIGRRLGLAIDNARLHHEARQALAARDELLSVAAHEMKSPITAIKLQATLLRKGLDLSAAKRLPPERMSGISQQIEDQVTRLGRLVDDLYDVARIQRGQLTLRREVFDLRGLLTEVTRRLEHERLASGSSLVLEADAPMLGSWDRSRLEQVLRNLLGNSIKYGAGRPIRVTARLQDDLARIAFTDQGIGIAPENQNAIFERFQRASSEARTGGLGLGLYIVRQILDAHGGTIRVESEPHKGSTFEVTIPISS